MVELKIENLHIFYDDFHAVRGINLTVNDGEILTLLGPSGCGKTTILRSIAGFIEPKVGDIKLGEKAITHLPARERDAGMIFQNYALWPHMTIEQNVTYGLRMRDVPKEERHKKAMAILSQVQLDGQADKTPGQLSGGQQQRVALARALVIEPTILLCDEPLSNLDFQLRVELRTEIRHLTKKLGVTTVYVTHDQSEALAISDKIAVINQGLIEQVGTPVEVFNDPNTLFVAKFVGENNQIGGKITKIENGEIEVTFDTGDIMIYHNLKEPFETEANEDQEESVKLEVGDRVDMVCRYDNIEVEPKSDKNIIKGKIRNLAYMGTMVQLVVMLSDDSKFTVNVSENLNKVMSMGLGSSVNLQVPESASFLFKDNKRIR